MAICTLFGAVSPLSKTHWAQLSRSYRGRRPNRQSKRCLRCLTYFLTPPSRLNQIYCSQQCAWQDQGTKHPKNPLGHFVFQQMVQRDLQGYRGVDRYCGLSLETTQRLLAFPQQKPRRKTLEKYAAAFGTSVDDLIELAGGDEGEERQQRALENIRRINEIMPPGSPTRKRRDFKAAAARRGRRNPGLSARLRSEWAQPETRKKKIAKLRSVHRTPHARLRRSIVTFRRWNGRLPSAPELDEITRRWVPQLADQGVVRMMILATLRQIVTELSPRRRGRPQSWPHEKICLVLSQEPHPTFPEIAKALAGDPGMAESLRRSHKHWHTQSQVPPCYTPKDQHNGK